MVDGKPHEVTSEEKQAVLDKEGSLEMQLVKEKVKKLNKDE